MLVSLWALWLNSMARESQRTNSVGVGSIVFSVVMTAIGYPVKNLLDPTSFWSSLDKITCVASTAEAMRRRLCFSLSWGFEPRPWLVTP